MRMLLCGAASLVVLGAAACDGGPGGGPDDAAADTASGPFAVADSLAGEGRLTEAAEHYRALRDSLAATPDSTDLWRAQRWLTAMLIDAGRRERAAAEHERLRELAGAEPKRRAWVHLLASRIRRHGGEMDAALAQSDSALEHARSADDRQLEAIALESIGAIHRRTGDYRAAVAADERRLAIERERGAGPEALANALNNLGIGYYRIGRLADAERSYQEALAANREAGDVQGEGIVLHNLANIVNMVGENERALRLMERTLELYEEVDDLEGIGIISMNLGNLFKRVGNLDGAREHYARAVDAARRLDSPRDLGQALVNLGRMELEAGDVESGRARILSTLRTADSLGYRDLAAYASASLAWTELARDRPGEAVRRGRAAVAIADSLGDPWMEYQALEAHARALEGAGRADAGDAYLEAIDLLESWRGRVALGDLRMGVVGPRLRAYEGAIRVLLAADRPADAFDVAERARARLLLELISEGTASASDGGTRTRSDSLRARIRELYTAPGGAETGDAEIGRLIAALDSIEAAVRRRDPVTAAARFPRPARLTDVRSPPRDGALLAYFWGERDVYGWWIEGDAVRGARLGAADSLAATVTFLRGAISEPRSSVDWRPVARRVFQTLVAPLDPGPAERITIIPDGPLAHLPLGVLVPDADGRPWLARRTLSYSPSASVLLALEGAEDAPDVDRAVLAVGDPIPTTGSEADAGDADAGDGDASAIDLPRLPHAATEVRALGRLFGEESTDVLVGRSATVDAWLRSRPERYRYLHFAAHAIVSDRRPDRTRLVLTGGDLDLGAIRRVPLNAELITLSACASGLGARVGGEGVIGLPHAFLSAGARGVLAALWRIDDRAAAEFMRAFYERILDGRSPTEALHAVQRDYATRAGSDAHPARWAPYVLVGSPRGGGGGEPAGPSVAGRIPSSWASR
ncbi:MAG: CHAT domain-containing protein [Gemmatimonadota bacterium]